MLIFLVCTTDLHGGPAAWALGQLLVTAMTSVFAARAAVQLRPADDQRRRRRRRGPAARRHRRGPDLRSRRRDRCRRVRHLRRVHVPRADDVSIALESGISLCGRSQRARRAARARRTRRDQTGSATSQPSCTTFLPLWTSGLLAGPVSAVLFTSRALSRSGRAPAAAHGIVRRDQADPAQVDVRRHRGGDAGTGTSDRRDRRRGPAQRNRRPVSSSAPRSATRGSRCGSSVRA